MIELYEHNRAAYEAVQAQLAETSKAAVIHPTGTGKSFIAFKLAEEHPEALFAWLSPSENIYNTQLENVKKAAGFVPKNIRFITYARLMGMTAEEIEALRPDYIILDEFHRAGAAEWGRGVLALLAAYPQALLVGLSATNVRYLDHQRDMAEELFDGCVADQLSLAEAVVRGILPAPKYVVSFYSYHLDIQRYKKRMDRVSVPVRRQAEQYLEKLRRALEKAEGLERIFARHMTDLGGKYIVFCANREHMQEMLQKAPLWFRAVDPEAHYYTVWADSASAKQDYAAFRADDSKHLKLLFCIDMFNEGIHVEDISGVILFRPTISPIIYKQQIGRALSAMQGRQPIIFDIVNNFENLYTISALQEEMREIVTFYRNCKREDGLPASTFEIIDEMRDCRELFDQLESTLKLSWEAMYREAEAYYTRYGDLNIPKAYRTEEGIPLGTWVQTQRRIYHGTAAGLLTKERIARLEAIGMVWATRSISAWEKGYAHALSFRQHFGHLDVPARYVAEDGFLLGGWISREREAYMKARNAGKAPEKQERFARLNALGMIWKKVDYFFETGVLEATRFAAENGHLNVPAKYVAKSGYKLGAWLSRIRKRQNGSGCGAPLTQEQIRRLEAIGMIWDAKANRQWEAGFRKARDYFKVHGHLQIPEGYIADGLRLDKWLYAQRAAYKNARLTPEQVKALEAIGMKWTARNKSWEDNYTQAVLYFKAHGDLEIPSGYVTETGVWLNKWVSLQRADYEKGKLSTERIRKLNQIGMRWQTATDYRWEQTFEALKRYRIDPIAGLESLPDTAETPFGANLKRWALREERKYQSHRMPGDRSRKWEQLRGTRSA